MAEGTHHNDHSNHTDHDTDAAEFGGYAESMAELESILASLENNDIDIDTLASQVERASLLIAHCEARLRDTELSLQQVLAQNSATSATEVNEVFEEEEPF